MPLTRRLRDQDILAECILVGENVVEELAHFSSH